MLHQKINISTKSVACSGAIIGVAAVFAYSLVVIIYAIIRSSVTILSIMPNGERSNILLANGFSIAYSVAIFSLLMAVLSSVSGAVAAVILKKLLGYLNPKFNYRKAIIISSIAAFAMLIIIYILLHNFLKDRMTFKYAETFSFWFLFPVAIFLGVCVIGGSKLNTILDIGITGKYQYDENEKILTPE